MRIWHYHPLTGELIGEGLADPSPLEPGAFIIPGYATNQEPPTPGAGEFVACENGEWVLKPIPEPEPDPMPTPAEAAATKRAAINARRDALEAASPFEYAGRLFDYDAKSRERLSKAVTAAIVARAAGMALDAVVATWTLYDNTTWDMTVADFLGFPQAEAERSGLLHETARRLKKDVDDALAAGATAEEIDAMPVWE